MAEDVGKKGTGKSGEEGKHIKEICSTVEKINSRLERIESKDEDRGELREDLREYREELRNDLRGFKGELRRGQWGVLGLVGLALTIIGYVGITDIRG